MLGHHVSNSGCWALSVGGPVRAWVDLGRLAPRDLAVELFQGRIDASGELTDPRVVEKSKSFLTLRVDLTHTGSPAVEKLMQDFRIVGVPTFVFLDGNGQELPDLRQVGFVPADEFLAVMDKALAAP